MDGQHKIMSFATKVVNLDVSNEHGIQYASVLKNDQGMHQLLVEADNAIDHDRFTNDFVSFIEQHEKKKGNSTPVFLNRKDFVEK